MPFIETEKDGGATLRHTRDSQAEAEQDDLLPFNQQSVVAECVWRNSKFHAP